MRYFILSILITGWLTAAVPVTNLPEETTWVLHLDMVRLKASKLVNPLKDILAQPEHASKMKALELITGIDPLRDFQGVTFAGHGVDKEDAVILIQGKLDRQRLETLAQAANGYQTFDESGVKAHSWLENQGDRAGKKTYAAFLTEDVLAFASKAERLKEIIHVAKGKSPSLVTQKGLGQLLTGESIVVGAARDFQNLKGQHQAMLQNLNEAKVALDERQDNVELLLAVVSKDAQSAEQLKKICEGMVALALMSQELPQAQRDLLSSARFAVQNTTQVSVTVSAPLDHLMPLIRSLSPKAKTP